MSLPLMGRSQDTVFIKNVISRIKKMREQQGITLQEFYNDTGIHLARIESEKRDLPISTLQKICKYFDVPLSEFFKGIEGK